MSFNERLGQRRKEIDASKEDWKKTERELSSRYEHKITRSPEYTQVIELLRSKELRDTLEGIWRHYAGKSEIIGLFFDRTVSEPKFQVYRQEEWKGLASEFVINLIIPLRHPKDSSYEAKSTFVQVVVELDIINNTVSAKWGLPIRDMSDNFEKSQNVKMKVRYFNSLPDLQAFIIDHIVYDFLLGPRGEFYNLSSKNE